MAQLKQHALQSRGKGRGALPTEAELREHLAENAEVVDIAAEQLAHEQVRACGGGMHPGAAPAAGPQAGHEARGAGGQAGTRACAQSTQSSAEMERADALLAAQLAEYGDDVLHRGAFDAPAPGAGAATDLTGDARDQAGAPPASSRRLACVQAARRRCGLTAPAARWCGGVRGGSAQVGPDTRCGWPQGHPSRPAGAAEPPQQPADAAVPGGPQPGSEGGDDSSSGEDGEVMVIPEDVDELDPAVRPPGALGPGLSSPRAPALGHLASLT